MRAAGAPPWPIVGTAAAPPVVVPIPGTASMGHLEENVAAASLELDAEDLRELS